MIPRLHVVTDDAVLADPAFGERARRVLEAGGHEVALHVRGPRTSGARVFAAARDLEAPAGDAGAVLLVNDRVDVALVLGLGAHLGARSLPAVHARRLLGPRTMIGVSVHDAASARASGPGRPDYLIVGTVFPSPSHPLRKPMGPGIVTEVASATDAPLLGIGGVTPDRVSAVLAAGAHGVAVVSGIWSDPRPDSAVGAYLDALGARPADTRSRGATRT